ncbi:MAG: HAD family hydrolase, partial [Acidimicrobiia bacterium]|nr:HAD family hydrolase [Acidimicrobiia bacterium]
MMSMALPSWRDGVAREALLEFLDDTEDLDPTARVAIFDNDGTLWCEKPNYPQLRFFVWELERVVAERPALGDRPEYRALLAGDRAALAGMGIERVGLALVELFAGMSPDVFATRVEAFFSEVRHSRWETPLSALVYLPMLELIDELRARQFDVFIGTAGGADFVRAVSMSLYGVPPERVVGSRVMYVIDRSAGKLQLLRTAELDGEANEGPAKLPGIQRQLGRRPIFAAGNSPGDAEMIEYASTGEGPTLGLVVNHDDGDREYAYTSEAGTFAAAEPILGTAARLG